MTRRVPFTAQQMFAVVADVERYPEFLPLCEGLHVRSREEQGSESVLIATMTVGYRSIAESFTSRVTLKPDGNEILVAYLDDKAVRRYTQAFEERARAVFGRPSAGTAVASSDGS
jgi:ribosome-associated toxin RatA of RatAB toxin-antitoxin module